MAKHYKFGHRMPRKSWKSSEIDPELENRKLVLVLLGLVAMFILMTLFMWWVKHHVR